MSEATAAEEDEKMDVTEAAESAEEGGVKATEVEKESSEVAAASESIKVEEEGEEMVDVEKDNKGWAYQSSLLS